VHLLTREVFEIYERHLKPGGVIVFHTSNHYLDLEPVVVNLVHSFQYQSAIIDFYEMDPEWWLYSSTWILVTRNEALLDHGGIRDLARTLGPAATNTLLWTDDFASMARILK